MKASHRDCPRTPFCPDFLARPSGNFLPRAWWLRSDASWMDVDRRKRQTFTATPAEPGDLPWWLGKAARATDVHPQTFVNTCGHSGRELPSRPGEFHPEPLTDPD